MKVGVIGAGVVGTAVAVLLKQKGYDIAAVNSLHQASADKLATLTDAAVYQQAADVARIADLLLITTPDREIGRVCREIAQDHGFRTGQTVIHMSGAHLAEILAPAGEQGSTILTVHPLQSLATVEQAIRNLPGTVFGIQGDEQGFALGRRIVDDLGGEAFIVPAVAKPLYHAGACVASNYLVTLMQLATRLLVAANIEPDLALRALLPLVRGTLNNLEKVGLPWALTGPIARGDTNTVSDHLAAMNELAPQGLDLYRLLGQATIPIGLEKGTLKEDKAGELEEIFNQISLKEDQQ